MSQFLLAIDQGTTNSRAILFDTNGKLIASHEYDLTQYFPQPGWVEQDALEMFNNTVLCCQEVIKNSGVPAADVAAIGITNQRETTIVWDKETGKPIHPAIVWQDRRTTNWCHDIERQPIAQSIQAKTGLLLDPYFSASKLVWLLDHVENARERANKGELLFGTVDCYLLWKLTNGKTHATDASNASRTMLFNIQLQEWDDELLEAFNIPKSMLPVVLDNAADFGRIDKNILGASIPIAGMAGDQQAATFGQACFAPGMIKSTYGTGCFMVANTGNTAVMSRNQLLTTVAYRLNGEVTYALEGSIFCAGVIVKWLRDKLGIISSAAETATIASSIDSSEGVYMVPAFTGLGAPYWDPDARGSILGLTRNSDKAHIVRAALESIAYQTVDLLHAMRDDYHHPISMIKVDGGMTKNDWLMQSLADHLAITIERPECVETTALGAAYLAGLQVGIYQSTEDIAKHWHKEKDFQPSMPEIRRIEQYQGWQNAVQMVLTKHD